MALQPGDPAPDLALTDEAGTPFKLSSLKGRNVVLYFYPKADTPGCATQACEFRDQSKDFEKLDAVIIGISPDQEKAQSKFKSKFDLPFTLLADYDHAGADAYGVWKEKSMYGKKYMGVERTTFLIDKQGKVSQIMEKVKPEGHANEVLGALRLL